MVTNRPEERLTPGATLQAEQASLVVKEASPHQHRWLVSFEGVDDRDAADALRGVVLRAAPLEEDGALWVHELIGSTVVDPSGAALGMVEGVLANPASDLLVLDGDRLVPLTFVVDTDSARRVVVVDPPEGLL
jgi:16S rRNA processing protein RimM